MKIRFTEAPKGRPEYKVGDVVEFNGPVPEGYARKYINRGWAVEVVDEKPAMKAAAPAEPEKPAKAETTASDPTPPRRNVR